MILQVAKRIVNVWRVPSSKALSCKHERLFDLLTLASPSSYIGQSISDSPCSHKLRLTADGLQAPAEKVDVVVEVAALDIGLLAPDAQKNRLARKRLFRVGQKEGEQCTFPAGQRAAPVAAGEHALFRIKGEVVPCHMLVGEPLWAPTDAADPGHQLLKCERLDEIIVCTQIKTGDPVFQGAKCRQKQDRRRTVCSPRLS